MFSSNSTFFLYKAVSPSNKIYIGITCETLADRISKHLYTSKKSNTKFSKAIRKYGINNIRFEILLENLDKTLAIAKEIEYINKYDTFKTGYNSTKGGEGAWGYKWDKNYHTIVHKKKFKFYNDPVWKKKKSDITKNILLNNPELKEKMINRLREYNKNKPPEVEAKRIVAIKSVECRIKASITRNTKPFNIYKIESKEYLGTYQLRSECAKDFNLNCSKIISCLSGARNQHKGCIFKYTDDQTVKNKEFNDIWLLSIKRKT